MPDRKPSRPASTVPATVADRVAKMRADIERAQTAEVPGTVPSIMDLMQTFAQVATAALEPDSRAPRYVSAVRNRVEVDRLSREGVKVREIARLVGISVGYVVKLRAELGLSRQR